MESILGLLKHFAVSRIVIVAAFIVATVLYVGPRVSPQYVPVTPEIWKPVIVGVGVFSGVIVFVWFITELTRRTKWCWRQLSRWIKSRRLNEDEKELLLAMGFQPREPLNLDNISYDQIGMSQLELLQLVNSLEEKGFVSINPYASQLISLTKEGRAKALKLQHDASSD